MSLDYPNRADWLAKRCNAVAGKYAYGRIIWTARQGTLHRQTNPRPDKSKKRALKRSAIQGRHYDFLKECQRRGETSVLNEYDLWRVLDLRGERKKVRDRVMQRWSLEAQP